MKSCSVSGKLAFLITGFLFENFSHFSASSVEHFSEKFKILIPMLRKSVRDVSRDENTSNHIKNPVRLPHHLTLSKQKRKLSHQQRSFVS